jgi:hypothetical protein
MNPVHTFISYLFQNHFNIILASKPGCSNILFLSGFRTKILYTFSHTNACYMPRCPHQLWFDHLHNTVWHKVQIMKPCIMQFSPSSGYDTAKLNNLLNYRPTLVHCKTCISYIVPLESLRHLRASITLKMTAFWDIAPCSIVEVDRRWVSPDDVLFTNYQVFDDAVWTADIACHRLRWEDDLDLWMGRNSEVSGCGFLACIILVFGLGKLRNMTKTVVTIACLGPDSNPE